MRLLPVGPDHVRFGAARQQPASHRCRYRRRDVRQHLPLRDLCAHSRSDQAGRERIGANMIKRHSSSRRSRITRRLHGAGTADAAAGGGLMLSLQPADGRQCGGRRDRCLRTERVHPYRSRRADRPDHALCRDGPGHLHVDPDADRRRAGGGSRAGAARARAAEREALRQSAAGDPGDRQFERDTRCVAAAAPSRRNGENHAGCRCGEALERRPGVVPRAKW